MCFFSGKFDVLRHFRGCIFFLLGVTSRVRFLGRGVMVHGFSVTQLAKFESCQRVSYWHLKR